MPLFPLLCLWRVRLCGSLALVLWLTVQPGDTAPVTINDAEGLIIAVDVSRSMRKQLPGVQRAINALVRGLDRQRPYHTVLVRFGATVEEVVELTLHDEVARGVFRSAVQSLRADQSWTHFDDLVTYLQRKSAGLGVEHVAVLVYSDGLCSVQPRSSKTCPDLASLGTPVPLQGFTLYVLRFPRTLTPPTDPATDTSVGQAQDAVPADSSARAAPIAADSRVPTPVVPLSEASTTTPVLTPSVRREEETPRLLHAHEETSAAVPASVSRVTEDTREPSMPVRQQLAEDRQQLTTPWLLLTLLGVGIGSSLIGYRWWRKRFRPVLLTLSFDGVRHEVPIETVPAEFHLGPTLGCDILAADMPAPCHLIVSQRALHLRVPQAWQVYCDETLQAALHQDGGTARYALMYGLLYRLTTPKGSHWLMLEHGALHVPTDPEPAHASHEPSQLSLLGIREGDQPWQP